MRKNAILTLFMAIGILVSAQTKVMLSTGGRTKSAILTENEATHKLVELLSDGPITIGMEDYGGFEKVGALPESLPTSNSQITTEPGDIMLYQGRNMVIFYGNNSWSYTRLGKIEDATASDVREFLGSGSISLTISLEGSSGVHDPMGSVGEEEDVVYDLNGKKITHRPLTPGIYIINGRKKLVR